MMLMMMICFVLSASKSPWIAAATGAWTSAGREISLSGCCTKAHLGESHPIQPPSAQASRRQSVTVVGKVERFEGLVELRDGLLIVQGTDALLPHKAA